MVANHKSVGIYFYLIEKKHINGFYIRLDTFCVGYKKIYNIDIKKADPRSSKPKEETEMKKIKASFDEKDRVLCVTGRDRHEFYYQPIRSSERILLFVMDEFSGSVWSYFREKGRNMNGRGFSLTIRELYDFKLFHNAKLTKVIQRITMVMNDVLSEHLEQKKAEKKVLAASKKAMYSGCCEGKELAA